MSDTTIAITKREAASTRAHKRLRKQDVIPGVLYGQGREPMPIQIQRVVLRNAFSGDAGRNAILSLVLDGGMIEHALHDILVAALPGAMPTEIVVDITDLRIAHSIHIRDLVAGSGYEFEGDPDAVICSCVVTRAALSEVATEEGDEGAASAEPALVGEEPADDAGESAE